MIYHYPYPERLNKIPKPDLKAVNGNIIVYGTEITGGVTAHALEQLNISFAAFADTDKRKHGKTYFGHSIISPNELVERYPDAIVLIASAAYKSISTLLLELGVKEEQLFPPSHVIEGVDLTGCKVPFQEEYLVRAISKNTTMYYCTHNLERRIIYELQLLITSRCALKCRECLFQIPHWNIHQDYDKEQLVNSVKKLVDLGYELDSIALLGGEPFLHHDLPEIIERICNLERIYNVAVVTNGTHSIKPELLDVLIRNRDKVTVNISKYGELARKSNEIEMLLNENNIRSKCDGTNQKWYKVIPPQKFKMANEQLAKKYQGCMSNTRTRGRFFWIVGGKYYFCNWAFVVENMGFKLPETDYVSLDDPDFETKTEKMFRRDTFFESCRYCAKVASDKRVYVPMAEQLP